MTNEPLQVSVCICTYCRPEQLGLLLKDLQQQTMLPREVVVVDNHPEGSGQSAVEAAREWANFPIRYGIQPVKNISLTRNATVELASSEWLAFLDDDERVGSEWLALLCKTAIDFKADGVLAPVHAIVPDDAPSWLLRRNFYHVMSPTKTGEVMPLNRIGIGNALLRGDLVRALEGPFSPRFGLTGGEDAEMLTRMVRRGAHIVSCTEAYATEPVEPARLNLRWILLRSLRGGQDHATHWLDGRFGPVHWWSMPFFYADALAKLLVSIAITVLSLPFGKHRIARGLQLAASNVGKLSTLWNWHYEEYK